MVKEKRVSMIFARSSFPLHSHAPSARIAPLIKDYGQISDFHRRYEAGIGEAQTAIVDCAFFVHRRRGLSASA